ncbi:MAG TPA: FAD-binding oxidoreductase [Candidatus Thermoplasmatota archaeon]|nr:FAD-binding oxidoreductase [Candidatus Thermoplasmatota archaeon]
MIRRSPALVARPRHARDVATLVSFARKQGLLVTVKGGGHHIAGLAVADDALVIDLSGMRTVAVDPGTKTARVGGGALLQDVDRETQKHGLATVLGFVSDTGVGGLTLGGGFGYLARRFGWAVDNLLEVEIVTADGRILRANHDAHPDLFWAVRGGGGNFGVVTEFTFRLHPVGPMITGGAIAWPAESVEEARRIFTAYREFTASAPRHLTVFLSIRRAPPAPFIPEAWHHRRVALALVCHSGPLDDARRELDPLLEAIGEPIVDAVAARPYAEQQGFIDGAEPHGMHYYWKSEHVASIPDALVDVVAALSQENPIPEAEVGFLHVEGALNERADDDGAVGNRRTLYIMGVTGMWAPDDPDAAMHVAWVREAWARFRAYSSGNYVNFQTADDGEDRLRGTYGANLPRLARVKRAYDPSNLFRANRNVRPTT